MKPFGIIRQQPVLFQVRNIRFEEKINPTVTVDKIAYPTPPKLKPHVVTRSIIPQQTHIIPKNYKPRYYTVDNKNHQKDQIQMYINGSPQPSKKSEYKTNPERKWERKLIFNHKPKEENNNQFIMKPAKQQQIQQLSNNVQKQLIQSILSEGKNNEKSKVLKTYQLQNNVQQKIEKQKSQSLKSNLIQSLKSNRSSQKNFKFPIQKFNHTMRYEKKPIFSQFNKQYHEKQKLAHLQSSNNFPQLQMSKKQKGSSVVESKYYQQEEQPHLQINNKIIDLKIISKLQNLKDNMMEIKKELRQTQDYQNRQQFGSKKQRDMHKLKNSEASQVIEKQTQKSINSRQLQNGKDFTQKKRPSYEHKADAQKIINQQIYNRNNTIQPDNLGYNPFSKKLPSNGLDEYNNLPNKRSNLNNYENNSIGIQNKSNSSINNSIQIHKLGKNNSLNSKKQGSRIIQNKNNQQCLSSRELNNSNSGSVKSNKFVNLKPKRTNSQKQKKSSNDIASNSSKIQLNIQTVQLKVLKINQTKPLVI